MSMDRIYLPRNDQPIVHLAERLLAMQLGVAGFPGPDCTHMSTAASLASRIGWTDTAESFAELDASIALDQLADADDVPVPARYDPAESLPLPLSPMDVPSRAASSLRSLSESLAPWMATRRESAKGKANANQWAIKYLHARVPRTQIPRNPSVHDPPDWMQPGSELVVVVRVYLPFKYVPCSIARMRLTMQQRISVLGSQTLAELRDRIDCDCTRHGAFTDISERPQPAPETNNSDSDSDGGDRKAKGANKRRKPTATRTTKTTSKPPQTPRSSAAASARSDFNDPGFFFITDTFYADTRQPCRHDYTMPIREWAGLHAAEIASPFEPQTKTMQETLLTDLRVRLGAPQVYQHSGNCEHVFCVSDVRLLAAGDARRRSHYPLVDVVSQRRRRSCATCGQNDAVVMVRESVLHMQDPAYLCEGCFRTVHYVDGRKVGEFKAYEFAGNRGIVLGEEQRGAHSAKKGQI